MKKVLFLINNLGGGGAEKVLVNLVNHMNPHKYDITLRTLIDQGENKKFLSDSINYEYVFKKGFRGINYLHILPSNFIYNKVAHGEFDVIIVYLHGVLTKIVSKAPESQKTITYLHANMHTSPFIKSFGTKQILQDCFKSYNAIVSVSRSVEDSFIEVSGIKDKLHVIYNTFDVQDIKDKAKESYAHDSLFNQSCINICSVGKLEKVKGYLRLLKAIKRLKNEEVINVSLNILGEGPERKQLEDYIQAHNLHNNIKLLGFKSNPYKYIANSDLFVSSSYSEGFSSVVVESIILGIPVLATECAGMKEILGENNEYGIVVENSDNALYEGLKKLLLDNDSLKQYKQKATERSSFFSTEKAVGDVEKLIDEVVNRKV